MRSLVFIFIILNFNSLHASDNCKLSLLTETETIQHLIELKLAADDYGRQYSLSTESNLQIIIFQEKFDEAAKTIENLAIKFQEALTPQSALLVTKNASAATEQNTKLRNATKDIITGFEEVPPNKYELTSEWDNKKPTRLKRVVGKNGRTYRFHHPTHGQISIRDAIVHKAETVRLVAPDLIFISKFGKAQLLRLDQNGETQVITTFNLDPTNQLKFSENNVQYRGTHADLNILDDHHFITFGYGNHAILWEIDSAGNSLPKQTIGSVKNREYENGPTSPITAIDLLDDNTFLTLTVDGLAAILTVDANHTTSVRTHFNYNPKNISKNTIITPIASIRQIDSNHFLSTPADYTAILWAVDQTGRAEMRTQFGKPYNINKKMGHTSLVNRAHKISDELYLTAGIDERVLLWKTISNNKPEIVAELLGHKNPIAYMRFQYFDGNLIVEALDFDGNSLVWESQHIDIAGVTE